MMAAGHGSTGTVAWVGYGEDLAFDPNHCGKPSGGFGLC